VTPTITPSITPSITPTTSLILTGGSIYSLMVEGGVGGVFEYYYEPCYVNDCGYRPMSHGVVTDFPVTIEFCARPNSVEFPPQYTDYTLTLICHNCCCGPDVPTHSPSPTPSITPTVTPTPSMTPSTGSSQVQTEFIYFPNL
jgi:hypothetical protein